MIDALFLYLSLLHIPNFLCVPTDENHNQDALLSFCHAFHWSVGEPVFPDVLRNIVAKPHPDGLSVKVNLLFLYCGDHNGAHLRCITSLFGLLPVFLNLLPDFNSTKSNQRRPLPSCEFLSPSCWISCNSVVNFNCRVCTSYKKLSSCDSDIDAVASTTDLSFISGASTVCASGNLPIFFSSHIFFQAFNFWDGRVTTLMPVSAALVSSFPPFTQLHIIH